MPGFDPGPMPSFTSSFTPANLGQSSTTTKGGGLLTAGLSFISDAIAYHRQKKLMDKQYEQAVEQWHRQNEYNSPQAQMQRFKDAGLNPDLIYGQMGNGAPAQMMSSEQNVSSHDLGSALQKGKAQRLAEQRLAIDNQVAMANIEVMKSEAERNRADAQYKTSGAALNMRRITSQDVIDRMNESNIHVNDAQVQFLEQRCNEIGANIDLLVAKTNYQEVLTAIAEIDKAFKTEWWKAEIGRLRSETQLNQKQAEKLEQTIYEMRESWETRFRILKDDERINHSKAVLSMAEEAANKWRYTLDSEGNPIPTKGGAMVEALDVVTGLLGRIVNVGVTSSSNMNQNDFYNHSSWHEHRYKYGKTRVAD